MRTTIVVVIILLTSSCGAPEKATTAPASTSTSASASASAPTPTPAPPAPTETTKGTSTEQVEKLHQVLARVRAVLGSDEELAKCKAAARYAELVEERTHGLRSASESEGRLNALDTESLLLASVSPNDPTKQIRARDLEQRLDELQDQIRRLHTRAVLIADTIQHCGK